MKKLLLAGLLIIATGALVPISADALPTAHPGPWRTVGVGDSIASTFFMMIEGDTYLNYETCRAPYVSGCPGTSRTVMSGVTSAADVNWSTVQAMAFMRSQVGTGSSFYFIVEEAGYADKNWVVTTDEMWRQFLTDVLRYTAGVCLIFLLPADARPGDVGDSARRRTAIAQDVFDGYAHRCIHEINWWAAARDNPAFLSHDGYHPSPSGAEWVAGQINAIVSPA